MRVVAARAHVARTGAVRVRAWSEAGCKRQRACELVGRVAQSSEKGAPRDTMRRGRGLSHVEVKPAPPPLVVDASIREACGDQPAECHPLAVTRFVSYKQVRKYAGLGVICGWRMRPVSSNRAVGTATDTMSAALPVPEQLGHARWAAGEPVASAFQTGQSGSKLAASSASSRRSSASSKQSRHERARTQFGRAEDGPTRASLRPPRHSIASARRKAAVAASVLSVGSGLHAAESKLRMRLTTGVPCSEWSSELSSAERSSFSSACKLNGSGG